MARKQGLTDQHTSNLSLCSVCHRPDSIYTILNVESVKGGGGVGTLSNAVIAGAISYYLGDQKSGVYDTKDKIEELSKLPWKDKIKGLA